MIRLTLLLVACLVFVSTSQAALAPHSDRGFLDRKLDQRIVKEASALNSDDELRITDETEVKLDDRACKYAEVPENAEITLIEVTADKKTVLKVHFRSRK